jgi:hypothetical protein
MLEHLAQGVLQIVHGFATLDLRFAICDCSRRVDILVRVDVRSLIFAENKSRPVTAEKSTCRLFRVPDVVRHRCGHPRPAQIANRKSKIANLVIHGEAPL